MTTLPPRPEQAWIAGPAGRLEAVIETPVGAAAGASSCSGVGVICHPHPLFGGSLQNKVVHTLARALQQLGLPTVRFNFRGVGGSEGGYGGGAGETDDTLAVIDYAATRWPGQGLTLAGFSFGGMVAYQAALTCAAPYLITVAPAVGRPEFAQAERRPQAQWLIVQGAADDLVDCAAVQAFAARFEPPPLLRILPGAEHFFHGRLTELRDIVVEFRGRKNAESPENSRFTGPS